MAFTASQLKRVQQVFLPGLNRMSNLWFLATEDASATVTTAGYFNASRSELFVGDTIIAKVAIGGTADTLILNVATVPASGNITVADQNLT